MAIPTATDPKLVALNKGNRDFWEKQSKLFRERFEDPVLRKLTLDLMADEKMRGIPLYHQMTIERAAERAAATKKEFTSEWAAKGGRAKKTNALQRLIEQIVAKRPGISLGELFEALERAVGGDVVVEILDGEVGYSENGDPSRELRYVPISGLKDRLTRAKKKLAQSR